MIQPEQSDLQRIYDDIGRLLNVADMPIAEAPLVEMNYRSTELEEIRGQAADQLAAADLLRVTQEPHEFVDVIRSIGIANGPNELSYNLSAVSGLVDDTSVINSGKDSFGMQFRELMASDVDDMDIIIGAIRRLRP